MNRVLDTLEKLSVVPTDPAAFEAWLGADDIFSFLRANAGHDDFVLYATDRFTFIHAILVPAELVDNPDFEDLMGWSCNADSSWSVDVTFSNPRTARISQPLVHTGSKILDAGEQLVFARYFEGGTGKKSYYEILQKFVHMFGLHYIEERHAYCRLDRLGDIEEVIRIFEIPGKGDDFGSVRIFLNRDLIDEYLVLTGSAIVRTFDFMRFRPGGFNGWHATQDDLTEIDQDLVFCSHLEPGHGSFVRGAQILQTRMKADKIMARITALGQESRQYASFITHDWRHKSVADVSCAPEATANYFVESNLPFEVSPAFFKPEVLLKYKGDTEKYEFAGDSISCRGAWSLKSFGINDAGQVHAYLVDLGRLPYEEQLYWKSYNEPPKAGISERRFKNDFEGEWDLTYDPLNSLKQVLGELNRVQVPWWVLRSEKLPNRVYYPVTSSPDQWENEILRLDQLLVEGFDTKWLRSTAENLGRSPEVKLGSIKLIEQCLIGLGFEEGDAARTITPLRVLHELRSKVKGHASGATAESLKKELLAEHGSYRKHFQVLCANCDETVRTLSEAFKGRT